MYFLNLVELLNYFSGRGFNIPRSAPRIKQSKGRSNLHLLCLTVSLSGKSAATMLDAGQHKASVLEGHEEMFSSPSAGGTGSVLRLVLAEQDLRANSSLSYRSGWLLILDNKPAGSRKHLSSHLKY